MIMFLDISPVLFLVRSKVDYGPVLALTRDLFTIINIYIMKIFRGPKTGMRGTFTAVEVE